MSGNSNNEIHDGSDRLKPLAFGDLVEGGKKVVTKPSDNRQPAQREHSSPTVTTVTTVTTSKDKKTLKIGNLAHYTGTQENGTKQYAGDLTDDSEDMEKRDSEEQTRPSAIGSPFSEPMPDIRLNTIDETKRTDGSPVLKPILSKEYEGKRTKRTTDLDSKKVKIDSTNPISPIFQKDNSQNPSVHQALFTGDRVRNYQTGEEGAIQLWFKDRTKVTIVFDDGGTSDWISLSDLSAA